MDGFDIEEQRGPHHYAGTGESEINKKEEQPDAAPITNAMLKLDYELCSLIYRKRQSIL